MTNGQQAIGSTGHLECLIENSLLKRGYDEFLEPRVQAFANRSAIGGKQFLKQAVVGLTIYQTPRVADFLIINNDRFPNGLIIECKWQKTSGSVDEKFPYLLFNILKTGVATIILLDGGGYRAAAKKWLSDQVDKEMNRALCGVWDQSEFQRNIDSGFFD